MKDYTAEYGVSSAELSELRDRTVAVKKGAYCG